MKFLGTLKFGVFGWKIAERSLLICLSINDPGKELFLKNVFKKAISLCISVQFEQMV